MVGPASDRLGGIARLSTAAALIVGLTLPALLCPPEDVARTSAGTFTLSYGGAVAIAVVSGAAWDVSGVPATAFVPLAVCGLALVAIALRMRAKKGITLSLRVRWPTSLRLVAAHCASSIRPIIGAVGTPG